MSIEEIREKCKPHIDKLSISFNKLKQKGFKKLPFSRGQPYSSDFLLAFSKRYEMHVENFKALVNELAFITGVKLSRNDQLNGRKIINIAAEQKIISEEEKKKWFHILDIRNDLAHQYSPEKGLQLYNNLNKYLPLLQKNLFILIEEYERI